MFLPAQTSVLRGGMRNLPHQEGNRLPVDKLPTYTCCWWPFVTNESAILITQLFGMGNSWHIKCKAVADILLLLLSYSLLLTHSVWKHFAKSCASLICFVFSSLRKLPARTPSWNFPSIRMFRKARYGPHFGTFTRHFSLQLIKWMKSYLLINVHTCLCVF